MNGVAQVAGAPDVGRKVIMVMALCTPRSISPPTLLHRLAPVGRLKSLSMFIMTNRAMQVLATVVLADGI